MGIQEDQAKILRDWADARATVTAAKQEYEIAMARVLQVKERGTKEQISTAMARLREASDALRAVHVREASVRYLAGE